MSNRRSARSGNPCAAHEKDYERALKHEKDSKSRWVEANKEFNALKDTLSYTDFMDIRRKLSIGEWPTRLLGPRNSPMQGYPSVTTFRRAKKVYETWHKHHAARKAATHTKGALDKCKKTPAYRDWLRSKLQYGRCGAPCTSRGREGRPCRHKLGARRLCPNHGARPA